MQLAQTVYYGREYKEKKIEKKDQGKTEAPTMAVRSTLKQPEKNAQRNPGEKGQTCYYCGKEGHLKRDASGIHVQSARATLEKRLPSKV